MATLGINDLKQYALPTYWDAGAISLVKLASGETYEQFISDVAQALAMQNAALLQDPLMGILIGTTDEMAIEYRVGVSNGFQDHTEYGRPDQKRAGTTGHMLAIEERDRGLGWTWDFLRKARRIQLDADIADAMKDVRDDWRRRILQRLFKSSYTAVGSGRSMPLADGGAADASFIPVNMPDRASAFDATHTHLLCLNGITQANLETAVGHLWEHGHDAPYDLVVAQLDIGSWTDATALPGYVPRPDPLIRYGTTQDLANVGPDVLGVIETDYGSVRLHANARIPTAYWTVFKSYGAMDQRNPMIVRYDPAFGVGAVLLAGDHIREYPLENAMLFSAWGANIADRTAAVVVENDDDSTYGDPTIA